MQQVRLDNNYGPTRWRLDLLSRQNALLFCRLHASSPSYRLSLSPSSGAVLGWGVGAAAMEMDVPGAEELEWLESNALLLPQEGEYDEEEYPPEEDLRADRGDRRPDLSPPNVSGAPRDRSIPCSSPDFPRPLIIHQPRIVDPENHAGRKRLRPDADSGGAECSTALPREEEVGNKRRATEEESDEDWLRYPLPKDAAAGAAQEADLHVLDAAEEKTISRFAWEIEGECLPVTGPGGERVYAKMTSSAIGVVWSKSAAAKSTSG